MARGEVILPGDLPPSVVDTLAPVAAQNLLLDLPFNEAKRTALDQFEASYVASALKRAGGNVSEAARQSGMDRANFRRILRKRKGSS
jgi:ActR/RegA family two-component response regulator